MNRITSSTLLQSYLVEVIPNGLAYDFTVTGKEILRPHFGKGKALHSIPHFTVFPFSDDNLLEHVIDRTGNFCQHIAVAEQVHLKKFNTYGESVLYIEPTKTSKAYMKKMVRSLVEFVGIDWNVKPPHLTIAKDLTAAQLHLAIDLMPTFPSDLNFLCDNISIRKFDPHTGHYTIKVVEFKFGFVQNTLF